MDLAVEASWYKLRRSIGYIMQTLVAASRHAAFPSDNRVGGIWNRNSRTRSLGYRSSRDGCDFKYPKHWDEPICCFSFPKLSKSESFGNSANGDSFEDEFDAGTA